MVEDCMEVVLCSFCLRSIWSPYMIDLSLALCLLSTSCFCFIFLIVNGSGYFFLWCFFPWMNLRRLCVYFMAKQHFRREKFCCWVGSSSVLEKESVELLWIFLLCCYCVNEFTDWFNEILGKPIWLRVSLNLKRLAYAERSSPLYGGRFSVLSAEIPWVANIRSRAGFILLKLVLLTMSTSGY